MVELHHVTRAMPVAENDADELSCLRSVMQLDRAELATILGTSEEQLIQWETLAITIPENVRRHAKELGNLCHSLRQINSQQEIVTWLRQRVPALGGKTPLEMLRAESLERVSVLVNRMRQGVCW